MSTDIRTSLRFVLGTLIVCAALYPAVLLGLGRAVVPERAEGSLIRDANGTVIGSRLVAQKFTRPEYLWPRPSAVDYDGAGSGGSNLGASNPELAKRADADVARLGVSSAATVPGDLIAASGSGLDPHITLDGALHQVNRIAAARRVAASRVEEVLRQTANRATPWSPPLVNVLEANLALDQNLGLLAPR